MMDDPANPNVEVNQRTSFGSTTTQIGQQNNYYGISPEQAYQMVINLFMQNFPKLQDIARETAESRVKEFCQEVIQKIISYGIQSFGPLADPDVQYILYEAQKNYARFGTAEMLGTLSELIAKRVEHDKDFVLKVAIDKAIEITPLLSQSQLSYLSLLFICTNARFTDIKTISDLQGRLNAYVLAWGDADFDSTNYLNILGCLQLRLNNMVRDLARDYNFHESEVEKICPEQIKKLSGDYTTSIIGTILAITNWDLKQGVKFDPKIWIK